MNRLGFAAFGAVFGVIAMPPAQAGPIRTAPIAMDAVGDVHAIYISKKAADTDVVSLAGATSPIFCNRSEGACTKAKPGDVVDLGVLSGDLAFTLDDLIMGDGFLSNAADAYGDYHAKIVTDYADFGFGPLSAPTASVIAAEIGAGSSVFFIGWEDLTRAPGQWSDFDYNDLVMAVAIDPPPPAPPLDLPEPGTIGLFGMGLITAAALRRRQTASRSRA